MGPSSARWIRRFLGTPLVLFGVPVVFLLSPLLLLAAAAADMILGPRRRRFLRVSAMVLNYLVYEWLGVLVAGVLWVLTGGGLLMQRQWSRILHQQVQTWWATSIFAAASRWLGLTIEVAGADQLDEGPVIIAARHASFFDAVVPSVLLGMHSDLLVRHVLKRELAWVPCIDIYGHRHPNHFVQRGGANSQSELDAIEQLATTAGPEALVIFPEGTFRSAGRAAHIMKQFAIREPERAQRLDLHHSLPPRPGGIGALMNGCPTADVVFLGHTGFERFESIRSIVQNTPFREPVKASVWRVPASDLGEDLESRMLAIDEWWQRMDDWVGDEIGEHRK